MIWGYYVVPLLKLKDMIKNCLKCGGGFNDKPSGRKKYCSRACASKLITKPCGTCGEIVTRVKSQMLETAYCSRACAKVFTSKRMQAMNEELNPSRMTLEVRLKLRKHRLGKGKLLGYEKTLGVHTHRIVAAEMIGRPLKKGEVVHHKDHVKRNNDPSNLEVLPSQAEHARIHKLNGRK